MFMNKLFYLYLFINWFIYIYLNSSGNQVLKQTAKERKGFSEDSAPKVKIDRLKIAASQKESQEKQQQ